MLADDLLVLVGGGRHVIWPLSMAMRYASSQQGQSTNIGQVLALLVSWVLIVVDERLGLKRQVARNSRGKLSNDVYPKRVCRVCPHPLRPSKDAVISDMGQRPMESSDLRLAQKLLRPGRWHMVEMARWRKRTELVTLPRHSDVTSHGLWPVPLHLSISGSCKMEGTHQKG